MDLVKIGSYIAEKRKKLGMTQTHAYITSITSNFGGKTL